MTEITYRIWNDFNVSYNLLLRKGGVFAKAASKASAVIGNVSLLDDPFSGLKITNHGENRIKKCVKYELPGACRLITIQDNKQVVLMFVGDHESCDKWLDKNRGLSLGRNASGELIAIYEDIAPEEKESLEDVSLSNIELYKLIKPEEYFDKIVSGLERSLMRDIESLMSTDTEAQILNLSSKVSDSDQASLIFDVFCLLRRDKAEEAIERIKLHLGESQSIRELTKDELEKLADSKNIKTIKADDPYFKEIFEHFANNASYMDWMLYLHPDQQKVVDKDFSGSAKLLGVSGSGKTCIVVHRAIRLAKRALAGRVLVVTLNRQLAKLISNMVDAACPPSLRDNIEVKPLFTICQELLKKFEPKNDKLYDDVTWKSYEHIDEVWREFYRCELNNLDAKVLIPVHDSLIARGVHAETYLREEFDWIRTAVSLDSQYDYLTIDRIGRGYPFDQNYRRILLDGLKKWRKKMRDIGISDYVGLSDVLQHYVKAIKPMYDHVIVDESQDFGTNEYRIIRALVQPGDNDIFLCGDAAQQVMTKHRVFSDAGINVSPANSLKVNKNYRNSREILEAAYSVLESHVSEHLIHSGDFEILDPEYANFSASAPLMLGAKSIDEEIGNAIQFVKEELADNNSRKACITLCGYSLYQIQKFGEKYDISVLDGNITLEKNDYFLSDLEHTKGFEFDTMVIVNCTKGVIPSANKIEDEQYRDLARLYVAMTRAKRQLVISYHGEMSEWISGSENYFLSDTWGNYIESFDLFGSPQTLEEIRAHDDDKNIPWYEQTGDQFLYHKDALGLDPALIEKLRDNITGKRLARNNKIIKWRNLGDAHQGLPDSAPGRTAFGPKTVEKFFDLTERLQKKYGPPKYDEMS